MGDLASCSPTLSTERSRQDGARGDSDEQQIPCGNDRKKSKGKGRDEEKQGQRQRRGEVRALPPCRQKEVDRMGHGAATNSRFPAGMTERKARAKARSVTGSWCRGRREMKPLPVRCRAGAGLGAFRLCPCSDRRRRRREPPAGPEARRSRRGRGCRTSG
jgi:hypothetical protein